MPKTIMGNFDVEALIELVKNYPFLYDIKHKKYKDAQLKTAIWESIAQKLNRNCFTVKHKWKTVRDGYIKYKKLVRDTEGSGKKVIEYIWSSQLAFLDSCDRRRVKNHWDKHDTPETLVGMDNSMEATSQSPSPSHWSEDQTLEPPTKRKKIELEEEDLEQILQYVNTSRLNTNDAVDHLFMSYAQTFKKISPLRQAELKIELANLFANAELKELESDAIALAQTVMCVKSEHPIEDNSESE